MIERHSTRYGNYWKSYDFASPAGNPNKNLSISPLGPQNLFGQGFEQDGGELIFSLPNGMQGYMLINGKGKKIDFAPSNIVKGGLPVHRPSNVKWIEPKGSLILPENVEEHAIVNGASCMVCHDQGMKIRPDEISLFFNDKKNLSNGGRTLSLQAIQLQYDSVSYEKLIKHDRDLFLGALKKSGVVNEPMGQVISNYVRDLDRKRIVAELRLSSGDLEEISRNSRLEKVQSILRQSQLGIKRSEFELLYPQLMKLILVELRNLPVPQDLQRQGLLSNEGFVVDTQSSVIEKTSPVEDSVKAKEIPAKLEDKQKALATEKELKKELEKKKLEKARLEEQARREKEQKEKIQKEKAQQEKTQLEKQKREKQELEKQKLEKQKLEKQKEAAKAEPKQQPEPKKQAEVKQEKAKGNPAVLALCGRFDNPGRKSACESRAASGAYQANAVQYCGKLIQADLVLRCLDRIRNRKISADQFNECPKVGGAGSITDTRLSDTEMRKRNEYASECL
ncbi:MAG TPA: cell envelope integrity protein TolA, partial [Pseudobdellovibrionaceae bacterium]|nr:cell envelope integrity protein TolA [Pseudobdellovibrionaceae bacterium]